MTSRKLFFEDLLGEHWGNELKLTSSRHDDYTHCIYSGDIADLQNESVLHLNLVKRSGLRQSGIEWRIYANGRERIGHIWGDREPIQPPVACGFEVWVFDQIADIIRQFARAVLAESIQKLIARPPVSVVGWHAMYAELLSLEVRLDIKGQLQSHRAKQAKYSVKTSVLKDVQYTSLALARCAFKLGDEERARTYIARFQNGYIPGGLSLSALTDTTCQALIGLLLHSDKGGWQGLMRPAMRDLASGGYQRPGSALSSQLNLFCWLVKLESNDLMNDWIEAVLESNQAGKYLIRYAAHLNLETMPHQAIRLLDNAIEQDGESPESIVLLGLALLSAGEYERAAAVEIKCQRLGDRLGIQSH